MSLIGSTYSTLFTFFKYTNQDKTVISYANTLRNKISRNSLGCFVNSVPLITKISGILIDYRKVVSLKIRKYMQNEY
jgi:hypothetical protein